MTRPLRLRHSFRRQRACLREIRDRLAFQGTLKLARLHSSPVPDLKIIPIRIRTNVPLQGVN